MENVKLENRNIEEEIFEYVKNNPGCTSSLIAHTLGFWQCDHRYLDARINLENKGILKSKMDRNANFSLIYFVVE